MAQSLGLGYDPKYEGLDPQYPPPPRVHWIVLALGWSALGWIRFVPGAYSGLLQSLVFDAWVFYLCNWIRRLDPESKSPFWCDVYVVTELGCAGLASVPHLTHLLSNTAFLLGLASVILGFVTIFLVRADLVNHYNNREHAGLVLNGVLTFFFSFIYFQYHLYSIAKRKELQCASLSAGQIS